jgi:Rrf2 family protein
MVEAVFEGRQNGVVRISAKEDYAVRALVELAAASGGPLTREQIADAQLIPTSFLQNILMELRNAGLVEALRGREGGFRLARPASEITVADAVRAVSGPLATVRGQRPPALAYAGAAAPLRDVWIALRANIRLVLEHVTLADVASDALPRRVKSLAEDPVNRC